MRVFVGVFLWLCEWFGVDFFDVMVWVFWCWLLLEFGDFG